MAFKPPIISIDDEFPTPEDLMQIRYGVCNNCKQEYSYGTRLLFVHTNDETVIWWHRHQCIERMTHTNPFENRDLSTILAWPTLSWSSYNAFTEYDKEDWRRRYVLGEKLADNPALLAGQKIGGRLATDKSFLSEVIRPEIYEQELKAHLGKIKLVGHLDGWSPAIPEILEYKTSQSATKWTQKSADTWGQLTFYCLLVWLNYKIPPEKIRIKLVYIPVKMDGAFSVERSKDPVQSFETKRTMRDVLAFAADLKRVHGDMEKFLSTFTLA